VNWCRGLKHRGRGGLKVHGGLHARLAAAVDENPVQASVAELGRVGVERVLTGIERGEAERAVLCRGGANLGARGLVTQNNRDAGERRRMQIG
jgi:hypothetical protein